MEIIASHTNTDFDGFASLLAAKKIYPEAEILLSGKLNPVVQQFLAIYRDQFSYLEEKHLPEATIDHLILVDTPSKARAGKYIQEANVSAVTVYDHHPTSLGSHQPGKQEPVGATITLFIEMIKNRKIALTDWERTLFALGLYTDTGAFTHETTTARDLEAAAFLFESGLSLAVFNRFYEPAMTDEQRELLLELLQNAKPIDTISDENVFVSEVICDQFINGLDIIVQKWLSLSDADACFAVAQMSGAVFVTARGKNKRIDVSAPLEKFGGGGHLQAAAAKIKDGRASEVSQRIAREISGAIRPAITAREMMSTYVKTVHIDTTLNEVKQNALRYGHSGFPVVKDNFLVGVISRRDADKAIHHGLGHAPVKGYMREHVIVCTPSDSIRDVQELMIENNIGRIPVLENNQLVGIISRTDLLESLHSEKKPPQPAKTLTKKMKKLLPEELFQVLEKSGQLADKKGLQVYLVGGIIRDFLLDKHNNDIDIVVEGDGLSFAWELSNLLGGSVDTHTQFKTAKITLPSKQHIDIATSRAEYYDSPAALPKVTFSNLRKDLERRDFTINAMALRLNEETFGMLIDLFDGEKDLEKREIRILHNLSFMDDPTRILRAIRFELRYGYTIEEETLRFAQQSRSAIVKLSIERIKAEFVHLFSELSPLDVFSRLNAYQLLDSFLPGAIWGGKAKRMIHLCTKDGRETNNFSFFMMFLPLFLFNDNFQQVQGLAKTKQEKQLLGDLSRLLASTYISTLPQLHAIARGINDQALYMTELYYRTNHYVTKSIIFKDYREQRKNLPLLLSGEDLKAENIPPGPIFKQLLAEVENEWFAGNIKDSADARQWLEKVVNQEGFDS